MLSTPYPFQARAVQQIEELGGRGILGHDVGSGKSVMALLFADENRSAWPVVVVCPAHLRANWRHECLIHLGKDATVLETTRPPKGKFRRFPEIAVVNYDILGRRRGENYGSGWLPWLKAMNPRLVICDEAHYLQGLTSRKTQWVHDLCDGVPYVLCLTGTPMRARPVNLFPLLNLLRPDKFPSFLDFGMRFCGARKTEYGSWDFKGSSNLDTLHKLLYETVLVREPRAKILPDLPKKQRHVVLIDVDNSEEIAEAMGTFRGWLRGSSETERKQQKLAQLSKILSVTGKGKTKGVSAWVDSFLQESDDKLLLFATHQSVVKHHKERVPHAVMVNGTVADRDRQTAFCKFNTDPHCRLFVGNIQAAGTGWNAKGRVTTAFCEFSWLPGDHVQAEGRGHGIGRGEKGRTSRTYYLVARGTIEEKLASILQRRQEDIGRVVDGEGRGESLDVMDLLLNELRREDKRRARA